MKWTQFFVHTSKEVPADAVVPSHQLMLRAGLIRQVGSGAYSYLPLGLRTLRKVENIVREEMNAAGAIELSMPALHPIELWQQTGRVAAMGDVLLGLGKAGGGRCDSGDWRTRSVLGPTHEEIITEHVAAFFNSYKQLPVNFYQIQTKFRGEARPKSGVLRTREFLMKDAYSFHAAKEGPGGLDETYDAMYRAYCRIFSRCGLPYLAVEADSGPIGGDASHEFMVETNAGEDVLVRCGSCGYAANTERADARAVPPSEAAMLSMADVATPTQRTIEEVCEFLGTKPEQMIKTLVYEEDHPQPVSEELSRSQGAVSPIVVLVRGDHEVNENKLNKIVSGPAKLRLASAETITRITNADVGFAGPVGLSQSAHYRVIVDQAVAAMRNGVTGANRTGYHKVNVNPTRDFPLEGDVFRVADVRVVAPGDHCVRCGSDFAFRKCIEVGHVFKLGTKYSAALGANFTDEQGKGHPMIMGCYGIGVNRIMAAAIEAGHDEAGIIWPASIAPFQVVICALDTREPEVMKVSQSLHDELEAAGVDVLLDDRDARPGFKFKDAELVGFPVRVTVGKKSLAAGKVEVMTRRDKKTVECSLESAMTMIRATLDSLAPTL